MITVNIMSKSLRTRLSSRRWKERNEEHCSIKSKLWREKNPERNRLQSSLWAKANPDKVKKTNREQYLKNRESRLDYQKAYMEDPVAKAQASERAKNLIARNPKNNMVDQAKIRARKRGLEFSISSSDFEIPEICPVFGIKLERGEGKQHDASPTLDRLNNEKGYTKDNIKVISWKANRMKGDHTLLELQTLVHWLEAEQANRS